jgi:hypothetical protein
VISEAGFESRLGTLKDTERVRGVSECYTSQKLLNLTDWLQLAGLPAAPHRKVRELAQTPYARECRARTLLSSGGNGMSKDDTIRSAIIRYLTLQLKYIQKVQIYRCPIHSQ